MRTTVCFIYITLQIIYLLRGDSESYWWSTLYINTHILFVAYLCNILEEVVAFNEDDRLLFKYVKFISVFYAIYTLVVCIKGESFAIHNTPVSAYILGISFVAYITHTALKK